MMASIAYDLGAHKEKGAAGGHALCITSAKYFSDVCSPKEKGSVRSAALWMDHSVKFSAQSVSCFDFLRWRRLISARMAVTINCASVSCSSLTPSISLRTSSGTLAVFCCDLLLTVPVAITELHVIRWCSVYGTKKIKKALKCKSLGGMFYLRGDLHLVSGETHTCYQHAWVSNHNVIGANTMAYQHSTQTRPKFQYRFLALSRSDMSAIPCRVSVEAPTEHEARMVLAPYFILSLAARLPAQGVCNA